jgi:TRAP-type uncharacterized transport system fused permease subunit
MLRKETRLTFKKVIQGLSMGARNAMEPLAACACAGIVVGGISLTGLGLKFAGGVITLAGGNVPVILILSAMVCLVLGLDHRPHRVKHFHDHPSAPQEELF